MPLRPRRLRRTGQLYPRTCPVCRRFFPASFEGKIHPECRQLRRKRPPTTTPAKGWDLAQLITVLARE